MFRLLGFCIGSLASMGALFLLIGTPDFHLGDDETDRIRFDDAVEKLKSKQALLAEPVSEAEVIIDEALSAEHAPAGTAPLAAQPKTAPEPPPAAELQPDEPVTVAAAAELPQAEWHSFWTPFRTRIAAAGFVGRLENVTGLDYRIVKVGSTGYEVEFAYGDESELDSKLERISAATGLDLSRDLP